MEPTKQFLPVIRPRAHSVNLLEYSDGRLLSTWFTGTHEGGRSISPIEMRCIART